MDVHESLERAAEIQAERDAANPQASDHESFDAFWAEVEAKQKAEKAPRTETILGVTVQVPTPDTMTLRFRRQLDQLNMDRRGTTEAEVRAVLADLFGPDALDAWTDAGMTEQQLAVVMAWGIACASGTEITWREAYEAVTEGKAPDRLTAGAAGAATSTRRSGGTGGRSKGGQRRKGGRRKR
ncbi:hypothetical protein GCM10009799_20630 [Nocardiopsis rhodophaea]|uniref:Tail assembly chaperone n=1 Tax=Nocardiopsis rhodophaea TaxID=280238 RepID=A0ABN2SY15_9ACTN